MTLVLSYDSALARVRASADGLADPAVATTFGAYLDGSALGTSGWTANAAAWEAITGIPLSAGRWFAGTTYTIGTTLSEMIAAGVRVCIDFAPPYDPVSSTDRASIGAMLADMKALGADVRVSLWHEPFFGGLTATEYRDMIAYYGPTVRAYYPLWAVLSGSDTVQANGYIPDADEVDGIAADFYFPFSTDSLGNCQTAADARGLPLGLWEFGSAHDLGIDPSPVTGATFAQAATYFADIADLFADRIAAGKPNGDLLFFSSQASSTGTASFLGSGLSQAGGFESGIGNWVAGSTASVAHSTAQAHSGTGSLAITCTSAGTISAGHCATANVTTQGMPVTAGQTVAFSAWFRPNSTTRTVQAGVSFYTSGGTFISNAFATGVAETGGAWTFNAGTAVAPANTAFARATPQISSAALSEVHYLDDPQIGVLPASVDHTAPIQYPWDHRIALLDSMQAALDGTGGLAGGLYEVQRSVDQISWDTVRGAAAKPASGGLLTVDDFEFADSVPNFYRVVWPGTTIVVADAFGPLLGYGTLQNANPNFETTASPWTAGNGATVARSTAQFHEGAASLLMTPDGVSSGPEARAENVSGVSPGDVLAAAAWVRCASSRNVKVGVNWRDSGGSIVATVFADVAVTADTWTQIMLSGAAPATTTQAQILARLDGTAPGSDLLYIDEARLLGLGITPTLGGVWLKSVPRPFLNRAVTVHGWSDVDRPARAGVFDVVGRSRPVAVSDVRGSRRWTLTVLTHDLDEAAAVDALLASGDTLLIHVPPARQVPGGYVTVGDTGQRSIKGSDLQIFTLPCTEVAAPGPDVVGATGTCQTVLDLYATVADVLAAFATCGDLLDLIGSPAEVIVP